MASGSGEGKASQTQNDTVEGAETPQAKRAKVTLVCQLCGKGPEEHQKKCYMRGGFSGALASLSAIQLPLLHNLRCSS